MTSQHLALGMTTLLLVAGLVGCGGGGSTSNPTSTTPVVTTITLTGAPANGQLPLGQTVSLAATARDAAGKEIPGTAFTWHSSDETKATVAGGLVTPKANGSVAITAKASGITSAPVSLTVVPAALTTQEVNRTLGFTKNLVTLGGFMGGPSFAMLNTPTAQLPLFRPMAPGDAGCATVSTQVGPGGSTITIDFKGCPNLKGKVIQTTTVNGNGTVHMETEYVGFGYDFAMDGTTMSGFLNGKLIFDGSFTVNGSAVTSTYRVQTGTGGLTYGSTLNGTSETWTQTSDFTSTTVINGLNYSVTMYGSTTLTGSQGTYSCVIDKGDPFVIQSGCAYPTSGTATWTGNGQTIVVKFTTPCGTVTVNGLPYKY